MKTFLASCLLGVVALTGCATDARLRATEQASLYEQHAGAPIDSFAFAHRIYSWTPLGRDALAVWLAPTRAYLLGFDSCPDLDFAQAIQITDSVGRVHARFDRVLPLGPSSTGFPCHIRSIRPLDVKAIREAQRVARATR